MQNKKILKFNILGKKRNMFIIAITLVLILLASVGSTVAFLTMKTPAVKNEFDPVTIDCEVENDYRVTNTGTYSAYIRAAVTVNYVKQGTTATSNATVYGMPPKENVDYTIAYNNEEWREGDDGFYYYTLPVEVGDSTVSSLITFNTLGTSVPDGYTLEAQVIAEAIQSQPTSTVCDNWNVTVNSSGVITGKK